MCLPCELLGRLLFHGWTAHVGLIVLSSNSYNPKRVTRVKQRRHGLGKGSECLHDECESRVCLQTRKEGGEGGKRKKGGGGGHASAHIEAYDGRKNLFIGPPGQQISGFSASVCVFRYRAPRLRFCAEHERLGDEPSYTSTT